MFPGRGSRGLAWDTVTFSPEDAKEKQKRRLKRSQGPKGQQTGRRQVIVELFARMKEARCRVMIQRVTSSQTFKGSLLTTPVPNQKPSERGGMTSLHICLGLLFPRALLFFLSTESLGPLVLPTYPMSEGKSKTLRSTDL